MNGIFRMMVLAAASVAPGTTLAQSEEELAKKLANPISSLISAPLQLNYDTDIGPERNGHRYTLNIQPVVPVQLSQDWNLITRTIFPLIDQHDIAPGSGRQNGLGDVSASLFFSPARASQGITWGVGPAFLLPLGSEDLLSSKKWGIGPTGVIVHQSGPWTLGLLASHIWSVAGSSNRPDISTTAIQPVLSHSTRTGWTYTANFESSYDWKNREATIPLNLTVSKLTRIGEQRVSLVAGVRYYLDSPDNGPHGWGYRLGMTFLFPH